MTAYADVDQGTWATIERLKEWLDENDNATPQQARLFLDVRNDFLFVEYVIAGGHDVDTVRKKFFGDRRRNGKSARYVFGVQGDDVRAVMFAHVLYAF